MNNQSKNAILRLVWSALLIGGILICIYLIFDALGITDLTREQIQDFVLGTGALAPIAFILVSFVQVTIVPIPGMVTILAGNYIFGPVLSFLYSYIGMMLGAIFAWWLGRIIGRPYVNWVAGGKEQADAWLKRLKGRETVFLFFAFFLPLFPDDLLCSVAGILPISFFTFMVMQVITRATSIGASLLFMSGEIIPFHGWGLWVLGGVALVCIAAFIICLKYADKLNAFFDNMIDKLYLKLKGNKKSK
jgi:uncharacterized membrane protein YdjX (TVP38/TMEM64 family)